MGIPEVLTATIASVTIAGGVGITVWRAGTRVGSLVQELQAIRPEMRELSDAIKTLNGRVRAIEIEQARQEVVGD